MGNGSNYFTGFFCSNFGYIDKSCYLVKDGKLIRLMEDTLDNTDQERYVQEDLGNGGRCEQKIGGTKYFY